MDSEESVWEFDCPQFVDFTAPHPLDDKPEVYFDSRESVAPRIVDAPPAEVKTEESADKLISSAAPGNICTSLAEWRKEAHQSQTDPKSTENPERNHKSVARKQRVNGSVQDDTSAPATRTSLKRSHAVIQQEVQQTPATKSFKRSVSSTSVGRPKTLKRSSSSTTVQAPRTLQQSSSTARPAEKSKRTVQPQPTLKRSSSASTVCAPQILQQNSSTSTVEPPTTLKRSNSTSTFAPPNTIKRSGSTASLNRYNSVESLDSRARSRSPALTRSRLRSHSRSPMTRARASSIGRQPIRNRGTSLERPQAANSRTFRPRSLDPRANISTLSDSQADCSTASAPPTKMVKLTFPNTPTFMRRQKFGGGGAAQKAKTTEEMEMERIELMRKQLEDKRKKNETMCKKVLNTVGYVPVHQAKSSTIPQEFEFKTDSRIKNPKTDKHEMNVKDFAHILRSNAQTQRNPPHKGGLTVVRPFNLSESRKRKSDDDETSGAAFKSMAQQVTAFHRQTPDRFRTRTKDSVLAPRGRSKSPPRLTIPKTPTFTKTRSRPMTAPSRKELEEKELEEMKNSQFKAHPMNQKIFDHANLGVKKVDSKRPTEPEAFKLSSDRRVMTRSSANSSTEEETHDFHARPVPTRILEGTVGLKPAKIIPVTLPQSPAFALKHRAPRLQPEPEEEAIPTRRRPVPHTGIPFQPRLSHRRTVVEPFPFEERDKERWAKKEEKIKQYLEVEKKARDFHANPLPDSIVSGEISLPAKQTKPATVAQAFELCTDTRGKKHQEDLKQKVGKAGLEDDLQQQRELMQFKAQANNVIYQDPFIPKKSDKALTDVSEFELNTVRRANHREAFEQSKKYREAQLEAHVKREELRKEEEEKDAIVRLRQEMVHRANPVKQYKQVEVQRSDKPLTFPESPNFSTTHRLRNNVRM